MLEKGVFCLLPVYVWDLAAGLSSSIYEATALCSPPPYLRGYVRIQEQIPLKPFERLETWEQLGQAFEFSLC